MVVSDEFERANVAGYIWGTTFPWGGRLLSTNGEQQLYLDDNSTTLPSGAVVNVDPFSLSGGILTISANPTPTDLLTSVGKPYTSGLISSGNNFEFKYGYIEMSAQLPAGQGLWPAFWLRWADSGRYGEIDIFEVLGSKPNYIYETVHWSDPSGTFTNKTVRSAVADMSTGFHTYGMDWNAETITFYFDGKAMGWMTTPEALKMPMYIMANVAVGGTWSGAPDATTQWPAEMKIDYIKVWQDQSALTGKSIDGTAGADFFSGTDGNDVIQGLDGSDTIMGGRGDDLILGGNGNDRLLGGQGNDTIDGGAGGDAMVGGAGDDTFIVDNTGDTILELAGYGIDTVKTSLASYGLAGPLEAMIYTGSGNFSGTGNSLDNRMESGAGNDTLLGGAGNDTLLGGAGADKLNSGIGDDLIVGGAGNDTMAGDAGRDIFAFLAGPSGTTDLITDFQPGVDRIDVTGLGITSLSSAMAGAFTNGQGNLVLSLAGQSVIMQGLKLGSLSAGDFVFYAEAIQPPSPPSISTGVITGTAGNDLIKGTAGNDTIDGLTGADTLVGGAGDDTYLVNVTGQVITETATGGRDTIITSQTGVTLSAYVENLTYTGSSTFKGVGNSLDNMITGGSGNDQLTGGAGNDTLNGGDGNDKLFGGLGDDVLRGSPGSDTLIGDAGSDTFVFSGTGGGQSFVTDFQLGIDHLDVREIGLASWTDVLAHLSTNSAGYATIANAGEVVTLQYVKPADLHATDFLF